jgi:hypothetical protein
MCTVKSLPGRFVFATDARRPWALDVGHWTALDVGHWTGLNFGHWTLDIGHVYCACNGRSWCGSLKNQIGAGAK